jgi:hypothetical protein
VASAIAPITSRNGIDLLPCADGTSALAVLTMRGQLEL